MVDLYIYDLASELTVWKITVYITMTIHKLHALVWQPAEVKIWNEKRCRVL